MIKKTFTQTQIIALGFFLMIAAGTLLLLCPFSSRNGSVPVLDALFTATSASCVTGLVTVDDSKCIGCQYCVMACPYGAISLESIGLPSATSETMAQKSMRSVAVRCDLCKDWMKREGKSVPACVEACPVHARSVVQIG